MYFAEFASETRGFGGFEQYFAGSPVVAHSLLPLGTSEGSNLTTRKVNWRTSRTTKGQVMTVTSVKVI